MSNIGVIGVRKVSRKINVVFDTSIYQRFLCTICDKLGISCANCENNEKFEDIHIEFLQNLINIVFNYNGCIYVYAEEASQGKGLDKEYNDLDKIISSMKIQKIRYYDPQAQEFLNFLDRMGGNIFITIKLNNQGNNVREIRSLNKEFVSSFILYVYENFIDYKRNYILGNDRICYFYFSKSYRSLESFKDYINAINVGKADCQYYNNIIYNLIRNVYGIDFMEKIKNPIKCYKEHLSKLVEIYSHSKDLNRLIDDLHVLMIPLVFSSEPIEIFYTTQIPDLWNCICSSELLDENNFGVMIAITFGSCNCGDSVLFVDRDYGKELLNELSSILQEKKCRDLVTYTCGGFIPLKTNKSNICYSIIYLCE